MKTSLFLCCAMTIATALMSPYAAEAQVNNKAQYATSDERAGVTAYVYGRKTILEFVGAPSSMEVFDDKGYPVEYERISERFYRLARQLEDFSAKINGEKVQFTLYRPGYYSNPTNAPSTMLRNTAPVAKVIEDHSQPISNPQTVATQNSAAPVVAAPTKKVDVQTPTVSDTQKSSSVMQPTTPTSAMKADPLPAKKVPEQMPVASVKVPETPAATERTEWDIKESDQNMRVLIQRWGSETSPNWKLKWEAEKDIPLGGVFTIKENGFKNAVLYITQLSIQSGVRVKPCFHSNNVVRVIHASAACKIDFSQKGNAQ